MLVQGWAWLRERSQRRWGGPRAKALVSEQQAEPLAKMCGDDEADAPDLALDGGQNC